MQSDSRSAQMYVYKKLLYQLGDQAGIQLLDQLVLPFMNYLMKEGRTGDAKIAITEAERVLNPATQSQMAGEISKIKAQVGL